MTAKDMFEKIGYVLYKNDRWELSYIFKNHFIIEFSRLRRMVVLHRKTNMLNVFWFGRWEFVGIDMEELEAIKQQIKELGW